MSPQTWPGYRNDGLTSIGMDDRDTDPAVVLPYLVGGPLAATEVYQAFGYRTSAATRWLARAG